MWTLHWRASGGVERFALLLPRRSNVGVQVVTVKEAPPADGRRAEAPARQVALDGPLRHSKVVGSLSDGKPRTAVWRHIRKRRAHLACDELVDSVE
jgi:hypothetical protein